MLDIRRNAIRAAGWDNTRGYRWKEKFDRFCPLCGRTVALAGGTVADSTARGAGLTELSTGGAELGFATAESGVAATAEELDAASGVAVDVASVSTLKSEGSFRASSILY